MQRDRAEAQIVRCADAICVSCVEEEDQFRLHYGNPEARVEIIAPGVEHAFFAPGDRNGARGALGLPTDRPLLLFVGRIQPLKGPDVAIRALYELADPTAELVIVGGASGPEGDTETRRAHGLVDELGLHERVRFVEPQPHHILSTYYRAADVVLAPSRSESFGLVALEAAACGIPVVASAVGGLLSLVDDGRTGRLIDGRDPVDYARAVREILGDDDRRAAMSAASVERARRYTWSFAAARLRRLYGDLTVRERVVCR
jgi:D-inositol-3-phosphate glycosyltransferase